MNRLMGKLAVVTGATRGIGKAIALRYASEGASCIAVGRNEELGNAVLQEMRDVATDSNAQFRFVKLDVANTQEVKAFAEEITKEFGGVDILVNNAGITRDGLLMKMKEEDWDLVLATNLKSVYNMSSAMIRSMMKKRSGRIINVSSVSGIIGNPGQTNYSASKAGVIAFTKSLAKEVAVKEVTVNAIAPGFIESDMTDALSEDRKQIVVGMIPMKRFGKVNEIACAAAFLASDEANYITGQTLVVDGGMT